MAGCTPWKCTLQLETDEYPAPWIELNNMMPNEKKKKGRKKMGTLTQYIHINKRRIYMNTCRLKSI